MEQQQVQLRLDYKDLKNTNWTRSWLTKFSYDLCIRRPWWPVPLTGVQEFANRQEFLNQQDVEGRTALFAAIKFKKYDLAVRLLHTDCNVTLTKKNHTNCLHMAVALGDVDFVTRLIGRGLNVDDEGSCGMTALSIASRFGDINAVRKLIESNCDLRSPDDHGFSPIHYAVLGCFYNIVAAIVDKTNDNANIDVINDKTTIVEKSNNSNVDKTNDNAYIDATNYDEAVLDLSNSSNVDKPDVKDTHPVTPFGMTHLMLAFDPRHDNCECAKKLHFKECLSSEFLSFDRLLFGGNVVHYAVDRGCTRCLQELIDPISTGFEKDTQWVEFKDSSGRTPLILAVLKGDVYVVGVLLKYAKVIDISPGSANSFVLHVAAAVSGSFLVKVLCGDQRLQPLINRQDDFGDTPLSIAYRAANESNPGREKRKTIEYLIKYGATCMHCPSEDTENNNERKKSARDHNTSACTKTAGKSFQIKSGPRFPIENWFTHSPLFKTYSPFRMALIEPKHWTPHGSEYLIYNYFFESQINEMIKSIASFKSCYLRGCREFIECMMPEYYERTALSLQEICRGFIRRRLGYRADEKVRLLSLRPDIEGFLNLEKLDEFRDHFNRRTDNGRKYSPRTSLFPSDAIDVGDKDILEALQYRRRELGLSWL